MISTGEGIAEFGVRPIHRFINDTEQSTSNTTVDDTKFSHLLAQQLRQGQVKTLHSFYAYGLIHIKSPTTAMATAPMIRWSLLFQE